VTFEIMELEKWKNKGSCANCYWKGSRRFCWWKWCYGSIWTAETAAASVVEVEEIKVVTKLTMASRKLKIKFLMS
jgi:DNA polymerase-3 subunit alpha